MMPHRPRKKHRPRNFDCLGHVAGYRHRNGRHASRFDRSLDQSDRLMAYRSSGR
jgi:hypothetical protein